MSDIVIKRQLHPELPFSLLAVIIMPNHDLVNLDLN